MTVPIGIYIVHISSAVGGYMLLVGPLLASRLYVNARGQYREQSPAALSKMHHSNHATLEHIASARFEKLFSRPLVALKNSPDASKGFNIAIWSRLRSWL